MPVAAVTAAQGSAGVSSVSLSPLSVFLLDHALSVVLRPLVMVYFQPHI